MTDALISVQQGPVEIMLRPEAVEMRAQCAAGGRIERIRYFGHDQSLHLCLHGGGELDVRSLPRPDLAAGQQVDLFVRGVVVAYPR